jgi:hypothetical protein
MVSTPSEACVPCKDEQTFLLQSCSFVQSALKLLEAPKKFAENKDAE